MTDSDSGETRDAPAPARILVIDDEEIIHKSLRKILRRHGHAVDSAMRAQEGLDRLREAPYDLVLTDLMMPEMNGVELLEVMRKEGIAVPVIMITGYPTIRTAVEALRLGAVDYLAKPFTRDELLGPVNRVLRRAGAGAVQPPEGALSSAVAPSDSDGYETPVIDLTPGDTIYLPEHAWATYGQDGTFELGVEASFLAALAPIASVELPGEGDLVEQGYVFARLRTVAGESHGVFVPLSGQVVGVNPEVVASPSLLNAATWLIRVLPTRLAQELALLKRRGHDKQGA